MRIAHSDIDQLAGNPGRANFTMTRFDISSGAMKEEVIAGLRASPKAIPPKYLYDDTGSALFDQICGLPEYYLTRTESWILKQHGRAILDRVGPDICVIEVGAGACQKGRILLETQMASTFFPVDISTECVRTAALGIAQDFPHVSVHAIAMDFLAGADVLEPLLPRNQKRLIFYAGSSIGNFDPPDAHRLLSEFHRIMRQEDGLLIGYDLRKDRNLLRQAYNDSRGITAAFNLNLLARLNRDLDANFDLGAFHHLALYNEHHGRIEMYLESPVVQEARIGNQSIIFDKLERIHTENSYKYTVTQFNAMVAKVGFDAAGVWTDLASFFAVGLFVKRRPQRVSAI
jgi:dimethylhistidine N-methyltransferase